ncbi:hypothetical protein SCHPADRAFT_887778 [Schizopora paradoxa]|uniref:Uncharacterized protein n=1 Tax=Schizopora paradoxa TaxID=27342 RepID=A0A0H2RWQ1_9AGAM|nr:hypothetical protein SCHPADRAFT_887778 [Schizopora paradoxa]
MSYGYYSGPQFPQNTYNPQWFNQNQPQAQMPMQAYGNGQNMNYGHMGQTIHLLNMLTLTHLLPFHFFSHYKVLRDQGAAVEAEVEEIIQPVAVFTVMAMGMETLVMATVMAAVVVVMETVGVVIVQAVIVEAVIVEPAACYVQLVD